MAKEREKRLLLHYQTLISLTWTCYRFWKYERYPYYPYQVKTGDIYLSAVSCTTTSDHARLET